MTASSATGRAAGRRSGESGSTIKTGRSISSRTRRPGSEGRSELLCCAGEWRHGFERCECEQRHRRNEHPVEPAPAVRGNSRSEHGRPSSGRRSGRPGPVPSPATVASRRAWRTRLSIGLAGSRRAAPPRGRRARARARPPAPRRGRPSARRAPAPAGLPSPARAARRAAARRARDEESDREDDPGSGQDQRLDRDDDDARLRLRRQGGRSRAGRGPAAHRRLPPSC